VNFVIRTRTVEPLINIVTPKKKKILTKRLICRLILLQTGRTEEHLLSMLQLGVAPNKLKTWQAGYCGHYFLMTS